MGNSYCNNISVLSEYNPLFNYMLPLFEEVYDTDKYIFNIDDKISFLYNDKKYRLVSENRKKEAERMTRNLDFEKDNLIVLFGIANIDTLELLHSNINKGSRVVIIEPNKYVLKYILQNYDFADMVRTSQFVLIAGSDETIDQAIKFHFSVNFSSLVHNIQVISLPNYHLYDGFRSKVIKNIVGTVDVYLKSLGNSLMDIFEGFRNNYQNIDAFMSSNSIDEITGKFAGYPAFIVASGPSLDKNIHHLQKAQDKALIITCDASYNACKKNNINPDVITSIERVEATYTCYYKDKEFDKDMVLAGPGVLWPNILEEYQGKKILMSKLQSGQDQWWASKFDNVKFVNQGFSCANVAFSVAKLAGCNPIILVGQDLAFTDEKIHSDSTHTKYEGTNQADRSNDLWVEDIHGGKVRTSIAYNLFREWFEYQIAFDNSVEIIDATEGGALIKGTKIMNLEEVIDQYCSKSMEQHLHQYLKNIELNATQKHEKYIHIIEDSNKQINKLKKIQSKAELHFKKMGKFETIDYETLTEKQLVNIVLKMQKGDGIVKYIIEKEKEVADFYQQIIKQTIIYVKQIGNQLTAKNVKRNLQLQMNLMYMINGSTNIIINEYLKLIEFLEKKDTEILQEMAGLANEK